MDYFNYRDNQLFAEEIPLQEIAARYGTPCYVYSRATITRHWQAFDQAFGDKPHLICYAVKANSNLAVLNLMARMGSGFDIVSQGELERVLAAGGQADKIVFSGVGKKENEIQRALEVGIHCFNVEVAEELDRIQAVAHRLDKMARISIRVNPDVDAKTHPYISTGLHENKFGIDINEAPRHYLRAAGMSHLEITGIDCHIGSQLTDVSPFLDALDRVLALAEELEQQGITIQHLDLGGGLGICYNDEKPPEPADYVNALYQRLGNRPYKILLEPGRAIVGNAGVLLTKVEYLKSNAVKNFAIVDAAMNDLLRPSLYSAWQAIVPLQKQQRPGRLYDVVGPVCETGDFLGKSRQLEIAPGDLLAVRSAGAYGFSMSSTYNSRPRPAEIMVDGNQCHSIRERERIEQLWQGEKLLPE